MKIDFHGRYRDIMGFITRPTEADKGAASFGKLLSDVLPKPAQVSENSIKTEGQSSVPPEARAMASLTIEAPTMQIPEPDKMAPKFEVPPPPSVKSPTILGATRISEPYERSSSSSAGPPSIEALDVRASLSRSAALKPTSDAPGVFDTSPAEVVRELVERIGPEHGIDPHLGIAVAKAESSFNPVAVSSDGHASKGLFQLLDGTANDIITREGLNIEYDPFVPEQNTEIGIRYLRYLHDLFSKETPLPNNLSTKPAANSASLEKLAVAAFNAGEGRVASAQDRAGRLGLDAQDYAHVAPYLPKTTQEYVERVLSYKSDFDSQLLDSGELEL